MNEIKVEPYIPDEDYDNPAMVVDFYEFTMANCLFLHGFKNTTLVFDMFFRKNPDNQGYSISAGQRKLTRFLLDYHFNEQDIHWLRTKGTVSYTHLRSPRPRDLRRRGCRRRNGCRADRATFPAQRSQSRGRWKC